MFVGGRPGVRRGLGVTNLSNRASKLAICDTTPVMSLSSLPSARPSLQAFRSPPFREGLCRSHKAANALAWSCWA
jgi:hypothetical protein